MAGSGSPKTNHSEISKCGGTDFSELPSYDDVLQGHQGTCVTIIDEETVFVAGGMQGKSQNRFYLLESWDHGSFWFAGSTDVYTDTAFFDLTSEVWTAGPSMTTPRWGHTCSLVTLDDGKKEIVIVGGRNGDDDPDDCTVGNVVTLRDVEILNLEDNSIRAGKRSSVSLSFWLNKCLIISRAKVSCLCTTCWPGEGWRYLLGYRGYLVHCIWNMC